MLIDHRLEKIPCNPPIEFANKKLEEAHRLHATEIISVGGGSTIDVGKYVAFHLGIPHIAIPTTCGTGSEVTKYAVFVKDGKKWSMENDSLIPRHFILEPSLLSTLSDEQAMIGRFDAICQAIESTWSPQRTLKSLSYSKRALSHALSGGRYNWQLGAHYSGHAINITRTSICHAISYPLTLRYGISHGLACAMTLKTFMKRNGTKSRLVIDLLDRHVPKIEGIDWEYVAKEALESERAQNMKKKIGLDELTFLLTQN